MTERIRTASDIVDVVSTYVTLKRAGRNFKGLCPFHNEKTPSFNVLPDKQIFKCFGCGQGGDVFKFVQAKEGIPFPEARELLAQRAGISIEDERRTSTPRSPEQPGKSDLERVNRWASRWFQKQLWESPSAESARKYAESRGISEESAQKFVIGFAPASWESLRNAAAGANIPTEWLVEAGLLKRREDGTTYDGFRNPLMFPIFDAMNRVVGCGGRALDDDPAKYVNSPQNALFDKSRCMYGIHAAKDAFAKSRMAVVVEGYLDCLLAQQFGFGHTVATLGTALTTEHARLLRRYVDSVTLVFDSDEAGRRAADRSLPVFIAEKLDVRLSHVPKGKDPADLLVSEGANAFDEVLTSATDALEFKWNQVRGRYRDAVSGPDRVKAIEEYLSLVVSSTDFGAIDPIQRGLILNQVGKLLGLSIDEVHRQLRIVARRSAPVGTAAATGAARVARAQNEASAVVREILCVLLNAPELFGNIEADFEVARLIPDDDLREIALGFEAAIREADEFSFVRFLSRFESAELVGKITDMQSEGERRGNYERSLELSLDRLSYLRESEYRERLLGELKTNQYQKDLMDEADPVGIDSKAEGAHRAKALAMTDLARRVNHFAPRKYLAAPQ
ncbi:MAG: DNA primase [Planctomycetes bacterium]|nr:DNA primase [Planctomycetota bacterium]